MSVALDILRTYRAPRDVQGRRMDGPPREDRALAIVMGACFLVFVAQWPRLAREAFLDPSIPLEARMSGALFAWLMVMPLFLYAFSLALQALLAVLGRRTSGFRVRMAIFWALLASCPLWLLSGLMAGFAGGGAGAMLVSALAFAAFALFATFGLVVAVRSRQEAHP